MRRSLPLLLLLAVIGALPASAHASYEYRTLSAPQAQQGNCLRLLPAGPGVARSSWTAPAEGYFDARLSGGMQGDWDLAVFAAGDRAPAAVSTLSLIHI